jgi:hypothetical protein
MNWRKGAAKIAVLDEPTVHWREPSFYLMVEFEQDRDAPRRSLKQWMNRQVCNGLSDGRMEANSKVLVAGSSAPKDMTKCQCIASEQLCQRSCVVEATTSSTR